MKEVIELAAKASRKKSDEGNTKRSGAAKTTKRRRTKGPSEKIRSLAALSLASKVGYLNIDDLIEPECFDTKKFINEELPRRKVKQGTTIYPTGRAENMLFLVKSGAVNIVRPSKTGRRFSIARLEAGSIFGEMPLVGQSMLGAQAEAAEATEVILINVSNMEKIISDSPLTAINVVRQIGPRLVESEKQRERAAFQPVTARIASLLMRRVNKNNQVTGLTHQEMADELGVYRETVTNALAELKADRFIAIGRKRIEILDPEALKRLDSF